MQGRAGLRRRVRTVRYDGTEIASEGGMELVNENPLSTVLTDRLSEIAHRKSDERTSRRLQQASFVAALCRLRMQIRDIAEDLAASDDEDRTARALLALRLIDLLLLIETRFDGRWTLRRAIRAGMWLGRLTE